MLPCRKAQAGAMKQKLVINQEVAITAWYFCRDHTAARLTGFPERMEFEGEQYYFTKSGVRCLVRKGCALAEVFRMSDGKQWYRLQFEPWRDVWTLMDVSPL